MQLDEASKWHVRNAERHRANVARWRAANKEKQREINATSNALRSLSGERAATYQQFKRDNFLKLMLQRTRARAKKVGLEFSLTEADFPDGIPERCPVLGILLTPGEGKLGDTSPSMDRLHNDKGYVAGNVIIVSVKANSIKRNATILELRAIADFYEKICKDVN